MKNFLLATLISSFIIACSGSDGDSASAGNASGTLTQAQIEEKFNLPPEPDPVLNNATILGVDSNNNDIRDDVERAIAFKYYQDEKAVSLFNQESKIDSKLISAVESNDRSEYLKLIEENGLLVECFFEYNESLVDDDLLGMTENTTERKEFLIRSQELMLSGVASIQGPTSTEVQEYCSKIN
tara:strand:+ start:897 stop:1445 length:549 start_codon:yes stop_codon:yes gene_type:complete